MIALRPLQHWLVVGALLLGAHRTSAADPTVQYSGALSYDVTHDADITWTSGGGSNTNVTLKVFLPAPISGAWSEQSGPTGETLVVSPGAQSQVVTHVQDNVSADYLYYTANYQATQPTQLRYAYTATLRNTTLGGGSFGNITSTLSQAAAAAGLDDYRGSSASIAAANTNVVALKSAILSAAGINPSSGLAKDAVRAFYDWVKTHMVYDNAYGTGFEGTGKLTKYSGPYYGGTYAGQCGDYSAILIALCRAAGIAARPVVGFWVGGAANQTHVWAELYFPSVNGGAGGWVPADPTVDQGAGYDHLGQLSDGNQRLAVTKAFDLALNGDGTYACPLLQVLYWSWSYSGGTPLRVPSVSYSVAGSSAATTRTITATASGEGTITPSGAVLVADGGSQQFTFTPGDALCYRIGDVKVDNVPVGAPASYTFNNVTSNHAIQVTFELDPANYDGDGNGTADASENTSESFAASGGSGGMATVSITAGTVSSAAQGTAPADAPSAVTFPFGFIDFALTGAGAGGSYMASIFVPYNASINAYYKRNRVTGAYDNIATAVSAVAGPPHLTRLDLTLTDGGIYDDDGLADGTLQDPGGPGYLTPVSAASGRAANGLVSGHAPTGIPYGGEWLSVAVAAAYAVYSLRRRGAS